MAPGGWFWRRYCRADWGWRIASSGMVELFLRGYGGVPEIFSHDFLAPAASRRQAWSCRLRPHCHLAFEFWLEESKGFRKFRAVHSGGGGVLVVDRAYFPAFAGFSSRVFGP